jgi:hypothetical protein
MHPDLGAKAAMQVGALFHENSRSERHTHLILVD